MVALSALVSTPGAPAFAQAAASVPQGKPQTGLKVIPLTIRSQNGRTHRFRVEYAGTEAQEATGMMFRPKVPRGTGMIFPMHPNRQATFWMHNTVSSLDLIFIAPGGVIESIAANAPPLSDAVIPSKGIVDAVLEIGPGEAARLGIVPGDKAVWTAPAPVR